MTGVEEETLVSVVWAFVGWCVVVGAREMVRSGGVVAVVVVVMVVVSLMIEVTTPVWRVSDELCAVLGSCRYSWCVLVQ